MTSEYLHRYSRKLRINCLRRDTLVPTTFHTRRQLGVDTRARNSLDGNPLKDDGGGAVGALLV